MLEVGGGGGKWGEPDLGALQIAATLHNMKNILAMTNKCVGSTLRPKRFQSRSKGHCVLKSLPTHKIPLLI